MSKQEEQDSYPDIYTAALSQYLDRPKETEKPLLEKRPETKTPLVRPNVRESILHKFQGAFGRHKPGVQKNINKDDDYETPINKNPKVLFHAKTASLSHLDYDDSNDNQVQRSETFQRRPLRGVFNQKAKTVILNYKFEEPCKFKGWRDVRRVVITVQFISRLKMLYDQSGRRVDIDGLSMSVLIKKARRRFYISPKSKKKTFWETIITLTMIYYLFFVPLRWGQGWFTRKWLFFDMFMDVIIVLDILMSFISGITTSRNVIRHTKEITKYYLQSYFVFDLITVFPYYLWSRHTFIIKMTRLVHLKRAFNLLEKKVYILIPSGVKRLRFLASLIYFVTFFNYMGAIWTYLGREDKEFVSWVEKLDKKSLHVNDQWDLYILAEYFTVNTFTTVGYGDMSAKGMNERVLVMHYQFLGTIMVALFLTQFRHYMNNRKIRTFRYIENNRFGDWMKERMITSQWGRSTEDKNHKDSPAEKKMLNEIEAYFNIMHTYAYRELTYENEFFSKAPVKSKLELSQYAFGSLFSKFDKFFDCFDDIDFKKEVASRFKLKLYSNNRKILKQGKAPNGLYFLAKGRSSLLYDDKPLFEVTDGFFYGDCLILEEPVLITLQSYRESCYYFFVSKADIDEICLLHPDSMLKMQKWAYERNDFFRGAIKPKFKHSESVHSYQNLDESYSQNPLLNHSTSFESPINYTLPDLSRRSHIMSRKTIIHIDENFNITAKNAKLEAITDEDDEDSDASSSESSEKEVNSGKSLNSFASPNMPMMTSGSGELKEDHGTIFDLDARRKSSLKKFSPVLRQQKSNPTDLKEFIKSSQIKAQAQPGSHTTTESSDDEEEDEEHDAEDSDNESQLNDSFEIPLQYEEFKFDGSEDVDILAEHLEERIQDLKLKMIKLNSKHREALLQNWKSLRKATQKLEKKNDMTSFASIVEETIEEHEY